MTKHEIMMVAIGAPAVLFMLLLFSERFRFILAESLKAVLIATVSCVAVMALAVVYVICPIDLIPDFIPVLGQLDDATAVVLAALSVPTAIVYCIGRIVYVTGAALGGGNRRIDR